MSVLDFVTTDKFIVRIVKTHISNPADEWVNSYEMFAEDAGGAGDLLTAAQIVVAFEVEMHINVVSFIRLTISTWEADSVPYDPTAFISVSLTDVGNRGVVGGVEPLNQCLSLTRVVTSGRFGHLFYRGALDSADVFSPAGRSVFVDATDMQTRVSDAVTASGIDDLFLTGTSSLKLAMINAAGTGTRPVVGLFPNGISTLPLDHAWFNRT